MYAIVEAGGKQIRVQPGDVVQVERQGGDAGDVVELDRVLMLADGDDVKVGTPLIDGAKVVGEVVDERRGKKTLVFKYKRKVRYRRLTGHRQVVCRLRIKEIVGAKK